MRRDYTQPACQGARTELLRGKYRKNEPVALKQRRNSDSLPLTFFTHDLALPFLRCLTSSPFSLSSEGDPRHPRESWSTMFVVLFIGEFLRMSWVCAGAIRPFLAFFFEACDHLLKLDGGCFFPLLVVSWRSSHTLRRAVHCLLRS